MDYDTEKVDQATLALLYLTLHETSDFGGRAWRAYDREALNRLHDKKLIGDPMPEAETVVITADGLEESRRLFYELFGSETA